MLLPLEGSYMLTIGLMVLVAMIGVVLTVARIQWKLRRRHEMFKHMRWLDELGLYETQFFIYEMRWRIELED